MRRPSEELFAAFLADEEKDLHRLKGEITGALFRAHQRRLNRYKVLIGLEVTKEDWNMAQQPNGNKL